MKNKGKVLEMDKRLEPIKDLEFNFNEEMKELIFVSSPYILVAR